MSMVLQFRWRKDFHLHGNYLLKTLWIVANVFDWLYFDWLFYWSPYLCMLFDTISCNIDEVLLINPSTNVFVFGDFDVLHKDWWTYSGETDRPGELWYNFSISNDLTQITLFGSLTVTLIVLLFRIYFFLLTLVFVLQWLSLHWEILIMWLSPCYFHWLSIRCPVSLLSLWLFLCWLGWYLWSFVIICSTGNICKLSVTAAANEFCEWVRVGIDVYIPYWKCQLNPQSSS